MRLAYFDEVKYENGRQPYFWFGCLLVPSNLVTAIDSAMAGLSEECFGKPTLCKETEFHASHIFQGKGNFKGIATADRINVLKKLCALICDHDEVGRIYVRLDPSRMHVTTELERRAFVFLVEKIEVELRAKEDHGMLIGDRDRDRLSSVFAEDLSRYRESSTPYAFGSKLTKLIDTVHFGDSHLSRPLQLADVYVFLKQLCQRRPATYPGLDLVRHIQTETNFGYANRYKVWPN